MIKDRIERSDISEQEFFELLKTLGVRDSILEKTNRAVLEVPLVS